MSEAIVDSPNADQNIQILRVAAACGAEISDVDLS